MWLNVIFVCISAVCHSFFFLTLISFVFMDFQKFSRFFQAVGPSNFGNDKFLQDTQKNVFFMWLTMEKIPRFIMKFFKKHKNVSIVLSNFYSFYCFFKVCFGEKLWLIFSKFLSWKPNLVEKLCFYQKIMLF